MTKKILYFTILLSILWSCKNDNKNKSEYLEIQSKDKINTLANRYLELNRFSGTIVVAKDDSIIYNQSFGLADYENEVPFSSKTAFKIGEITKLITSDLINRLVKEKKILLTDKVSEHLPEIESDIRVGDLMKHDSNVDYNIAGQLIEKVTNKSYQENIAKYSAELGLENTYFQKNETSSAVGYLYHNYSGNGLELEKAPVYNLEEAFSSNGLKSTANDLMKILKSYPKQIHMDGYLDTDGFSYSIVNDLENKKSIVVLSNRKHPVANEISNSIDAILEGKEFTLPLLREPFDIDKTILKDFTGKYALNENVNFEVLNSNDSLFVLMGPNKVYLVPQSSNQFYMKEADASMRFSRDSTDMVDKIVLLNGFIDSEQIAYRKK
ncbi:serine hydrolase domain-containing protein [Marixanthomonas spongiae]|uniref:Serine hydrolase n=1 Tax=Marixanthomonas spongiae TaxID=2174845 RepID=A0A2U0HWC8_9FLAO|nr:serine hydrolase domain-containing protein [Marixanthomonas spongiae]PVW13172.1 serine hydrolase [Marixanthomonas spongiae]